jgi:hypothetical protein
MYLDCSTATNYYKSNSINRRNVVKNEDTKCEKQIYEKPLLTKHGKLKDVTTQGTVIREVIFGCTRF